MTILVRLTPRAIDAGGTRSICVQMFEYDMESNKLLMILADGNMCIQLTGAWEIAGGLTLGRAHTCDHAERLINGAPTLHLV